MDVLTCRSEFNNRFLSCSISSFLLFEYRRSRATNKGEVCMWHLMLLLSVVQSPLVVGAHESVHGHKLSLQLSVGILVATCKFQQLKPCEQKLSSIRLLAELGEGSYGERYPGLKRPFGASIFSF